MSFCAMCGTEANPSDEFCRQCGSPRLADSAQSTPHAPHPGTPYGSTGAIPPPPPGTPYGGSGAPFTPPASGPYGAQSAPVGQLADWGQRFLALLIDAGLGLAVFVPFLLLGLASDAFLILGYLATVGASIYFAVMVGQYGQSPGMRVIGLKCIGQATGQPIGAGLGIVRALAHIVDSAICDVGFLFPLWDPQRQTLADKIMSTVVITVPKQAFSLTPPA